MHTKRMLRLVRMNEAATQEAKPQPQPAQEDVRKAEIERAKAAVLLALADLFIVLDKHGGQGL